MAYISDTALDAMLAQVAQADRAYIASQEPANFTEATSTYKLGEKTSGLSWGSAADRSPNGRKRTLSAITGGSVTGTGTASHWALVQNSGSVIWATGALSSSQGVTNGNTFALGAIDIGVADAA